MYNMGGGINGLIRYSYYKHIVNKETIINCFTNNETTNIDNCSMKHINMICEITSTVKDNLDKSHFIHIIEQIQNSLYNK